MKIEPLEKWRGKVPQGLKIFEQVIESLERLKCIFVNKTLYFTLPDDLSAHDSQILIESHSEGHINVRLGFLQVKHVYEVQFSIEDDLGDEVQFDPLQNINVKIDSIRPSEDGEYKR